MGVERRLNRSPDPPILSLIKTMKPTVILWAFLIWSIASGVLLSHAFEVLAAVILGAIIFVPAYIYLTNLEKLKGFYK